MGRSNFIVINVSLVTCYIHITFLVIRIYIDLFFKTVTITCKKPRLTISDFLPFLRKLRLSKSCNEKNVSGFVMSIVLRQNTIILRVI